MFEYWLKTDLQELPSVDRGGFYCTQDSGANKIGVEVTDGGEPITLTGNVEASIILPNGETITENGSKSANKAWVVLPDECYLIPGQISVFLRLINGQERATLGGVEGYVHKVR